MTPHIWTPDQKPVLPPGLRKPIFPGERGWDDAYRLAGLVNGGMVNGGHAMVNGGVIRAAAPSTWLQDEFNGTAGETLATHNPDIGGAYSGDTGSFKIGTAENNSYYSDAAAHSFAVAYVAASGADQRITMVINRISNINCELGVAARYTPGSGGSGYLLVLRNSPGAPEYIWIVQRLTNGGSADLGAGSFTNANGNHTIVLTVTGTTVTADVEGSQVYSGTDATHAGPGGVGLLGSYATSGAATGLHAESILAEPA